MIEKPILSSVTNEKQKQENKVENDQINNDTTVKKDEFIVTDLLKKVRIFLLENCLKWHDTDQELEKLKKSIAKLIPEIDSAKVTTIIDENLKKKNALIMINPNNKLIDEIDQVQKAGLTSNLNEKFNLIHNKETQNKRPEIKILEPLNDDTNNQDKLRLLQKVQEQENDNKNLLNFQNYPVKMSDYLKGQELEFFKALFNQRDNELIVRNVFEELRQYERNVIELMAQIENKEVKISSLENDVTNSTKVVDDLNNEIYFWKYARQNDLQKVLEIIEAEDENELKKIEEFLDDKSKQHKKATKNPYKEQVNPDDPNLPDQYNEDGLENIFTTKTKENLPEELSNSLEKESPAKKMLYCEQYFDRMNQIIETIKDMKSHCIDQELEKRILLERTKILEEKLEEMNEKYVKEKVNLEEVLMEKRRLADKIDLLDSQMKQIYNLSNLNYDAFKNNLQDEFNLKEREWINYTQECKDKIEALEKEQSKSSLKKLGFDFEEPSGSKKDRESILNKIIEQLSMIILTKDPNLKIDPETKKYISELFDGEGLNKLVIKYENVITVLKIKCKLVEESYREYILRGHIHLKRCLFYLGSYKSVLRIVEQFNPPQDEELYKEICKQKSNCRNKFSQVDHEKNSIKDLLGVNEEFLKKDLSTLDFNDKMKFEDEIYLSTILENMETDPEKLKEELAKINDFNQVYASEIKMMKVKLNQKELENEKLNDKLKGLKELSNIGNSPAFSPRSQSFEISRSREKYKNITDELDKTNNPKLNKSLQKLENYHYHHHYYHKNGSPQNKSVNLNKKDILKSNSKKESLEEKVNKAVKSSNVNINLNEIYEKYSNRKMYNKLSDQKTNKINEKTEKPNLVPEDIIDQNYNKDKIDFVFGYWPFKNSQLSNHESVTKKDESRNITIQQHELSDFRNSHKNNDDEDLKDSKVTNENVDHKIDIIEVEWEDKDPQIVAPKAEKKRFDKKDEDQQSLLYVQSKSLENKIN